MIEKDYWVVWTLDRLFSLPDLSVGNVAFKKVLNVEKSQSTVVLGLWM
jgi:hypothetical protein